MDKNTLLRKMLQFLEEEKELQTEYALAVAEATNGDPHNYFKLVQDYQFHKGRVKAIRDSIELVEEVFGNLNKFCNFETINVRKEMLK